VTGAAPAKLNLALVVGDRRADGLHELLTVFQRLDLADTISVEPADSTTITGFPTDTLVGAALASLAAPHGWRVVIEKRIPVASGLGGGSSDAATALALANAQLERPVGPERLHELAAALGADVPFFLRSGPQLGSGSGTALEPVEIPQEFVVCLLLPNDEAKRSTATVYEAFDARSGAQGFAARASALRAALAATRRPRDLGALPANDLARSAHAASLLEAGAFRADVSGAGPMVYGLFEEHADAERACALVARHGRCFVANPAW
jgi:4-diphosphocytidyl-2-C-methyl-D-erythritol kinase